MTEKGIPTAPLEDRPTEQKQLFGIRPGNHRDLIHYDVPLEAPAPFVIPEKPKRLEDMTAEEMIIVALSDRLTPDIYSHFPDKRADFTREHHWTPYSEGEATRSIGGGLVNYLLGANARGGLSAIRDVLDDVDRERAAAGRTIDDIRLVQDPATDGFNPEWARGNTVVRQALARAILARNSLNLFQWLPRYDERKKRTKANQKKEAILLALTDKLARLDDETMLTLLQKTLAYEKQRLAFASAQVDKAREDDKTHDLVAAARSRG